MKLLQTITLKLICLGMLVCAVALIIYPVSDLYELIIARVPESPLGSQMIRVFIGIVGCAIAIWGLIPLSNGRSRHKTISFPDAQGTTTVHLDSIEKTLKQEISRQPEIKRISVQIEPADDNRRVRIMANVVIRKGAGISTRDVYSRMKAYIVDEARNILGPDEVAGLDLNVEGIIADKRITSSRIEEVPVSFDGTKDEADEEDDTVDVKPAFMEETQPEKEPDQYGLARDGDDDGELGEELSEPEEERNTYSFAAAQEHQETSSTSSTELHEDAEAASEDEEEDQTAPSILDVEPVEDDEESADEEEARQA